MTENTETDSTPMYEKKECIHDAEPEELCKTPPCIESKHSENTTPISETVISPYSTHIECTDGAIIVSPCSSTDNADDSDEVVPLARVVKGQRFYSYDPASRRISMDNLPSPPNYNPSCSCIDEIVFTKQYMNLLFCGMGDLLDCDDNFDDSLTSRRKLQNMTTGGVSTGGIISPKSMNSYIH
mmetsp:Transcript_5666/g.7089  ORF Transcript_5666/g.7089 Transcript_5666/m.7089 type:complete len:183 (-) Transcript_5666:222-770(-)|eukprot:CAMPEP_0172491424 /NCGR_PEP_ID=MMETSP1066-20121228/22255_1 /TAXON_ID=671091 /ORGANISM="Coscinodiscus wailesii, Strain CCMP2513" /LENGTH=182 /DNA_ID=CAMNT_0013260475 /DNA_START=36 /DNA_END=584 /DNA_ORIENTATION=-